MYKSIRFLKKQAVRVLIKMAHMEITTGIGCRIQCKFCPQPLLIDNYQEKNQIDEITWGNPALMSFENFKISIDKIPKHVEIHFSGFFEPWLNPECTKMLLYAHETGHTTQVFTTLVGMTLSDVEQFKHIPFKKFSIHLPDVDKFAKIAITKNFLDVLRKILSSKIRHLHCMSMGKLPDIIQREIGINLYRPHYMHDRAGTGDFGDKTAKKFGPLICSRASKNGVNTLDENVLLPNGDVGLCCMDYGTNYVIGNLLNSDYDSLFQGEKFQEILEKLDSEDSDIMCRTCHVSIPPNAVEIKYKEQSPEVQLLNEVFEELLMRYPNASELNGYHDLLTKGKMSLLQIKKIIMESEEYKRYNFLYHE